MKTRDKVLVYAIIFSAAWHIFWLSAFSVTVTPKIRKPVKFSSVSFLGPILDRGVFSVNVKPRESTPQEAAFLDLLDTGNTLMLKGDTTNIGALPAADILSAAGEEDLTALAISKIDTNKAEPGRDVN